jgi:hypothetical protein
LYGEQREKSEVQMMEDKISPDALYGRIYAEIQRRSDVQEKTVRLNIVVLTALFGWVLTGLYFHPTIYLIAAVVNLTFALKWLSEDRNIAYLTNYLLDNSDAPLEKWQRDNFDSLYPWWLKCGDVEDLDLIGLDQRAFRGAAYCFGQWKMRRVLEAA